MMNERTPWIVVALLAAALLWTHFSHGQRLSELSRTVTGPVSASLAGAEGEASSGALLARVLLLETQISELRQGARGTRAGSGSTHASRAGTAPPGGHRAAVAASAAAMGGGEQVLEVLESGDPEVRERLRDVIDDELTTRREQRREDRRAQRTAQAEQMVMDLVNEYGVPSGQAQTLRDLLADEHDQIREFFQTARQDHTWGEARDKAQDLREENDGEVGELLSDEAFEGWQTKREEEIARYYGRRR